MPAVCRNLCERLYSKILVGTSKYGGGPCCGMKLRLSQGKKDEERLRHVRSLEQLTEIHERQNNKGSISRPPASPTTDTPFTPPS
jgi:hypothetical protein